MLKTLTRGTWYSTACSTLNSHQEICMKSFFLLCVLLVRRYAGFGIILHQSLSYYTKQEMKYMSWKQYESVRGYYSLVNEFNIQRNLDKTQESGDDYSAHILSYLHKSVWCKICVIILEDMINAVIYPNLWYNWARYIQVSLYEVRFIYLWFI